MPQQERESIRECVPAICSFDVELVSMLIKLQFSLLAI